MNLRDETTRQRWPMQHYQMYEALGLNPKRHLPDAGHAGTMIGNVYVWVVPKTVRRQDAKRMWCACPCCGRTLTAGKLAQHIVVHKGK